MLLSLLTANQKLKFVWEHRVKVLLVVVILLLAYVRHQRLQLKNAEILLAAKPKVEEKTRIVRVMGPVKIVERIREIPGGERIIERITERAAERHVEETERHEEPLRLQPPRLNRWLAGAGLYPFESGRPYSLHAGYSFNNRIDLLGGFEPAGKRGNVLIVFRF